MNRILFFETCFFTGATRVTQTISKKLGGRFETRTVVIKDIEHPKEEIQNAISKENPAILFCSFVTINPDVIIAGREQGLTVIVRQDYKLCDLTEVLRQRVFNTYPKANWIITQTHEMKQELLSCETLKNCRIKVIENPLDEEDILEKSKAPNPFSENGNFHFLWVGRKDPIKDLPTLYKAFQIVHKQYPQTDLTLISDDSNPYRWMKNADCMVISSISEASPNVLREALFLGIKVVSTDCSPTIRKLLPNDRIAKTGCAESLSSVMIGQIKKRN